RSLAWANGRHVFPADAGRRIAYRLTGAPAGARVLRVVDGVGTQWLALQAIGGAQVFADSVGSGEDVLYYLHATPRALAESRLELETRAPAEVIENLRDGSIAGARRNPEYLILAPAALLPEAVQLRAYRDNPARLNPTNAAAVRLEPVY